MKTNPNDPAFPVLVTDDHVENYPGLTKREYFAAMAMQGALAGDSQIKLNSSHIAEQAIHVADYLIAALNQETP